jgi:Tol biopolymer transport system component
VRILVPGSGSTLCPLWSSDGKRVAYLDRGTVVVRGLDGSTPAGVAGDPRVEDFGLGRLSTDPLLSPRGDRIARLSGPNCQIIVARPDGTDSHVVPVSTQCGYALATWSPDGRHVLLMQDVSGIDFTVQAIAVDSPFDMVTIVSTVRTNGARSWPGWGDVSWQPVLR